MQRPPLPSTIRLAAGAVRRLPPARAGWLSVVRGRVWLTRSGEPADHFLVAGQSLRLPAGAELWLGAEPDCELQWLPDAGRPSWRSAAHRLWQRAAQATIGTRRRPRGAPVASIPAAPWTCQPTNCR